MGNLELNKSELFSLALAVRDRLDVLEDNLKKGFSDEEVNNFAKKEINNLKDIQKTLSLIK